MLADSGILPWGASGADCLSLAIIDALTGHAYFIRSLLNVGGFGYSPIGRERRGLLVSCHHRCSYWSRLLHSFALKCWRIRVFSHWTRAARIACLLPSSMLLLVTPTSF